MCRATVQTRGNILSTSWGQVVRNTGLLSTAVDKIVDSDRPCPLSTTLPAGATSVRASSLTTLSARSRTSPEAARVPCMSITSSLSPREARSSHQKMGFPCFAPGITRSSIRGGSVRTLPRGNGARTTIGTRGHGMSASASSTPHSLFHVNVITALKGGLHGWPG